AVGAQSFLHLLDHPFQRREGLTGFAAPHEVAADVDLRADLDVADLVMPAQLGRLTVELQRGLEVAELLVKPSEAVGDPADVVVPLPIRGLDEAAAEPRARFRVEPTPDVRQPQRPVRDPLVELVVDGLCLARHPALDLDGLAVLAPPVVDLAEVPEAIE